MLTDIMNLVLALQEDNIEQVSTLIEKLNLIEDLEVYDLSGVLDINNYERYKTNKSINYLLLNLKGLNRAELTRWELDKYKLLESKNKKDIESFIRQQIECPTYKVDDQKLYITGLIQLIVRLEDHHKTAELFELLRPSIQKLEESEENN